MSETRTVITLDLAIARTVGVNAAIVLQEIALRLEASGTPEVALTYAELAGQLGELFSERTIQRAIAHLESEGHLASRTEGKGSTTSSRKWYSIPHDNLASSPSTNWHAAPCQIVEQGAARQSVVVGEVTLSHTVTSASPICPAASPRAYICNTPITPLKGLTDEKSITYVEHAPTEEHAAYAEHAAEEKAEELTATKGKKEKKAKNSSAGAKQPDRTYDASTYDFGDEIWARIKAEGYQPEGTARHVLLLGACVLGLERIYGQREVFFGSDIGGNLGRLAAKCLKYFVGVEQDEVKGMAAALDYVRWYVQVRGNEWLDQTGKSLKGCFTEHNYTNTYRQARSGRPSAKGRGSLANGDGVAVLSEADRNAGRWPRKAVRF